MRPGLLEVNVDRDPNIGDDKGEHDQMQKGTHGFLPMVEIYPTQIDVRTGDSIALLSNMPHSTFPVAGSRRPAR